MTRMSDQKILWIPHPLHTKTATHIRIGDTNIGLIQPQMIRQIVLQAPNTLTAKTEMQTTIHHFGETAAGLHRVHDDTVIKYIQSDHMGRIINGGQRALLIPHAPIKGEVIRGSGMKRLATNDQINMNRQIINLNHDGLSGIFGS